MHLFYIASSTFNRALSSTPPFSSTVITTLVGVIAVTAVTVSAVAVTVTAAAAKTAAATAAAKIQSYPNVFCLLFSFRSLCSDESDHLSPPSNPLASSYCCIDF
jgi:hypothetical protein